MALDFLNNNRQKKKDPLDDLQRQIENLNTRIEGAGMEKPDPRNWFEKMTNLPEDQNAFFDFLELLDRPRQALTNLASSKITEDGRSAGQALWDGFSGKQEVHGRDILDQLGMEEGIGRSVLGFGIDVVGDPLTYVPPALLAKAGKTVGQGVKAITPEPVKDLAQKGKDALGEMFNPTHGMDITLDGAKSDDLINLRRSTLDRTRYETDEALQRLINATKPVGGLDQGTDVARVMEFQQSQPYKELMEQKNALDNPLDIQAIDQQIDDLWKSTTKGNQAVIDSATRLTESNRMIRQLAEEKGLGWDELEGYMRHAMTEEARKAKGVSVGSGRSAIGGDKRVVQERKHEGTVEEINKAYRAEHGHDLFEPNAFLATADGQRKVINYIMAESAKKEILANPQFARPITKDMKVPKGDFDVIDPNDYDFFKNMDDTIRVRDKHQSYLVTKGAKKVLDQFQQRLTDEGINKFIKTYDKIHDTWKKYALFSVGFHVRNHLGNNFNMWIAGMSPNELLKYQKDAVIDLKKAKDGKFLDMYDEFKRQGLREGSIFQQDFRLGNPQEAFQRALDNKTGGKRRTPFEVSRDIGARADEYSRYAMYKWARETKKLSPEESASLVREALFDYAELTPFEQRAKRLIPFYTWTRNNVPYQLMNLATQPRKYASVEKARQTGLDYFGMDDESLPEWLRESMAIPVHGDGQGSGTLLGLNLPLADLSQISDPTKMFVDSLTPLVKLPIELGTNYDMFKEKPIKEFQGQTENMLGFDIPVQLQHILSQLGALRNLSGHVERSKDGKWLDILTGNTLKHVDADKQAMSQLYDELRKLEETAKLYRQQTGRNLPTLKDLEN